jgi:hypothetical protein
MNLELFQVQTLAGTSEFMAPEVANFEDISLETGYATKTLIQYLN